MDARHISSEIPADRSLELELDLSSDASYETLEALLKRVVETSGGRAGMMATWDEAHPERGPRTAACNLDEEAVQALAALAQRSTAQRSGRPTATLMQLEEGAREATLRAGLGPLEAFAVPVRLRDRSVGLLFLLHPEHVPAALHDSPGTYNLRIDHADLVVQNARLLQRLMHERRFLEAAVQHSGNAIVILDQGDTVVGFNVAMERISGWSLDEAVGRPGQEMFPLEMGATGASLTSMEGIASAPGAEAAVPTEARLRTRDGDWVEVEVSSAAMRDDAGALLGWIVNMRDIRPRKEKERLERIFLSGVSHELQTPIAVIKGFAGLLSDADVSLTPEQVRDKAAIIREESCRLERMVAQMLDATRIQSGGVQLETDAVALDMIVRRVAQKLEPLAREAGARLVVNAPRRLEPIGGDPGKIEQVVSNLIENALKYAVDRSRPRPADAAVVAIEIAIVARPGEVEVSVSDTGPGVPEADRERIFAPFERGATPLTKLARGTGLGLFICKAIVEAHGGRIGVEGRPQGGARFYFTLPRPRHQLTKARPV